MSERIRRPDIERTQPLRGWEGVFGPPPSSEPAGADGETDAATARTAAPATHAVEQAVTRSVEIGYQVIDHYLRQGQEVARSVREGRASTASLVRDTTDLSTRMVQYASDFVGTWMELLEIVAAGGASNAGRPPAAASAPPQRAHAAVPAAIPRPAPSAAAAGAGAAPVVLAVRTGTAVEASLDLDEVPAATALRVSALRGAGAQSPRIEDVAVTHDGDGRVVVRVTVGDQPPGTYEGIVTDDARNVPVGRVRLTIL